MESLDKQYAEFKSDKLNNLETIDTPFAFSVAWTEIPNATGVKPPNPQFQMANNQSYILPRTMLPSTNMVGQNPVGIIQSKREPYGVEHYYNQYGSLNSRTGTQLGR